MDEKELDKVDRLFHNNRIRSGYSSGTERGDFIAIIATVVDLVREELKAIEPKQQLKSGTAPDTPIPIGIFLPGEKDIYNVLFSLGYEYLKDITGWRRGRFGGNMTVFEIRIKGRYATMPAGCIGLAEIEKIGEMMERCGLPFNEEPMEPGI